MMYKLLLFIVLLVLGCMPQAQKRSQYKTVLKEIAYNENIDSLKRIPLKEIKTIEYLVYGRDTFKLKNYHVVSFEEVASNKKHIFRFNKKGRFVYFICDSLWRVEYVQLDNR